MRNDFNRSGKFRSLAKSDIVEQPSSGADIKFATWRLLKQDYIVVGHIKDAGNGMAQVSYELWDVNKQQSLLDQAMPPAPVGDLRGVAHQIADQIYEKITGVRGAFWTRIAYITAVGLGNNTTYSLIVADSDGYNPQVVARSKESLLSPSWSPDGKKIAYVSFESGNSNIYVQDITTGSRQLVESHAKGINGAPAWSPDGTKLAVSLSYVGNPEIFVAGSGHAQGNPPDPQPVDRYRAGLGAGWPEHLFHLRSLRSAADLQDRPPAGGTPAAHHLPGPEQRRCST